MNEEEYIKQQRREINRRAYLKRIKGNIKNYSKNINDDRYINFLEKTKKIEKNEKDLFGAKIPKEKNESDEESISNEDNNVNYKDYNIHYDVNDNINKTHLNYYLNKDNMRQRKENTRKAVNIENAQHLYPPIF